MLTKGSTGSNGTSITTTATVVSTTAAGEGAAQQTPQPATFAVGDGGPPWLARLPPDCLRHVLQHLALTPSGGPQLTRIACTCRALRDALAQSHIEISEL